MPRVRIGIAMAAAAIFAAGTALAQDVAIPPPDPPTAKSTPLDPATSGNPDYFARQGADQWLSTDFVGKDVYGPDRQKVGTIVDLLFAKSGNVTAAVVGVGGFLGMGEKEVAVPFSELQFSTQDGARVITLNATRQALKAAPSFAKAESPG